MAPLPLLLLVHLLLFSSLRLVFSGEDTGENMYILGSAGSTRSHFLATGKGAQCNSSGNKICNGVAANGGAALLYCCNMHCRDVLRDRNNCGRCGQRCGLGQLCCSGVCTATAYNADHCGKCNNRCQPGTNCDYGLCSYA